MNLLKKKILNIILEIIIVIKINNYKMHVILLLNYYLINFLWIKI